MSAKRRAGRKRKCAVELDSLSKQPRLEVQKQTESSSGITEIGTDSHFCCEFNKVAK